MKVYAWCFDSPGVCDIYFTAENGDSLGHYDVPARIYARRKVKDVWRNSSYEDTHELVDLLDLTEAELDTHSELQAAMSRAFDIPL